MNVAPPTHVLYVITKASWGGAQRYVFDLALAARDRGYRVTVAYGEPGLLADRLSVEGIDVVRLPALARDVSLFKDIRTFFGFVRFFRQARPDIVHLNSSKAAALGSIAARMSGVRKIVHTAHGWAFNEARPFWQRISIACVHALAVWFSHITVCVSDAVRRDIAWIPFSRKKLKVLPLGVHCESHVERMAARTKLLPAETDRTWIGMLSELHPTKRIEDAIDAMSVLHETYPDLRLVVCGTGEHREFLEKRIGSLGLEERVFLIGFVQDAALYLKAFDVFLHTSRSEAGAYAVLEAGYASLPTVATRVGGIPEIVQDGLSGILVPAYDPGSVASALRSLLEEPERAQASGQALHAYVSKECSRERMFERTFALY